MAKNYGVVKNQKTQKAKFMCPAVCTCCMHLAFLGVYLTQSWCEWDSEVSLRDLGKDNVLLEKKDFNMLVVC